MFVINKNISSIKILSTKLIQIFYDFYTVTHFLDSNSYPSVEFFSSFKRKQLKEATNLHSKDINNISCSSCHLEVGLQNVDSSWKCFMSTTTEQCNTSIQQDGSNQRCIGNTSQAFDATLKAPYKKRKFFLLIYYIKEKKKVVFFLILRNA